MAGESRIPRMIDGFNPFIINTNTYMLAGTPPNWQRAGWVQAEMTLWTGYSTSWAPLYAKYSDKKGSRTTAIKDQLHLIIKQCIALDKSNHLLDRIAASAAVTITDMETFHIKKGVLQATKALGKHTVISDAVVVALQPIGGGNISVKCRTGHDSKRPSIAAGSNSVQYAYQVAVLPRLAPIRQG